MREILFRGKPVERFKDIFAFPEVWGDNIQCGLVIGSLVVDGDRYYIAKSGVANCRQLTTNGITTMVEVIPETVGQCTGIPDGNNRKMYDGDICCFSIFGTDSTLVKISYRYGTPGFEPVFPEQVHPDDRRWKSFYRDEDDVVWNPHYFRVIGNIHEQGVQ